MQIMSMYCANLLAQTVSRREDKPFVNKYSAAEETVALVSG